MTDAEYATTKDEEDGVPDDQRCIWPGCTRRRAPGRTEGSGRQKEYCLKADPPENGGGPVHNARNRWTRQRGDAAGNDTPAGASGAGADDAEARGAVRDDGPVSTAKQRASELLDQARRQHTAALAAFTGERELYARVAEQFQVMADPAALDLEITAINLKAGRNISAAGEEVARVERARLDAERERDRAHRSAAEADAAAEQFAADTEVAERVLTERTAEFERDREVLARRAIDAEGAAEAARAEAVGAKAASAAAVADAQARADMVVDRTQRLAQEAVTDARSQAAQAREQAADQAAVAQAETARAREAAERARAEVEAVRIATQTERDIAQARTAAVQVAAAASDARAAAAATELDRLRNELDRLREVHSTELARLDGAHRSALSAERARALRAEAELDGLRATGPTVAASSRLDSKPP